MIKLKCKKCGRLWDYKGEKKFYTSCPDCKTSVKIEDIDRMFEDALNHNLELKDMEEHEIKQIIRDSKD